MKTYIALDLETTGFDPAADQVIEIAAIKFQGDKIIDQFETLINPEIVIPQMVSHITGITADVVADAPKFEDIEQKLIDFIGNYPIVGHNIDFDLTFLRAKGLPINQKQFDTLELAGILLPGLPSYSLDTISRVLKIEHTDKHRAMSDTHVCFVLFNILTSKIAEISPQTLKEIQAQIEKTDWDLKELFYQAKLSSKQTSAAKQPTTEEETPIKSPETEIELLDLFDPNSTLSEIIPGFEPRPSQRTLTDKILYAFQNNSHLIAEAGTGTGKTFGYLLPACFWSQKHREKIIITTHTNNLQDQIVNKDFPTIQKLFPKVKIAILKGKRKYLSVLRFNHLKSKSSLEIFELIVIIKVILWLEKTETGDLDELNLQNKEMTLLDEICCGDLSVENHSERFLQKARSNAEKANIIIINHALLLQDALTENSILPEYKYLIVDEAHHLNKITTDALTINLTPNYFKKNLDHFESLIQEIQHKEKANLFNSSIISELEDILYQIKLIFDQIRTDSEEMFHLVSSMLSKYGNNQNEYQQVLNINIALISTDEWIAILKLLENIHQAQAACDKNFNKLISNLNDINEELSTELIIQKKALDDIFAKCRSINQDFENKITWISKTIDENLHLQSVPINISQNLRTSLFDYKKSIILTSATLTTNHSFTYFRRELGLGEDFDELQLPSNFSYPDQVKIIIPDNLPEPRDEQYIHHCAKIIKEIILKNGGRTLILFTAKRELTRVFHMIAPDLKNQGINLLGQSISGGRGKIISQFKDEPDKSAILGTNSFWEGVDILGQDLSCVVIQKLPFDPPEDPIIKARSNQFNKPFEEFSLPRAILRFKQGFGRLIRSSKDTGSVIILDSRLVNKYYGQQFVESLPSGIHIEICSKDKTADCL